tara:strand:+ start:271 stop:732 length:462 start_codon:yes stop_codon:yes gene_type:complete
MAHFAKLNESNVVTDVNVFDNAEINANGGDWSAEAETYVNNMMGGTWKQCSYHGTKRKSMAGIGYTYDSEKDIFIWPKPYPSWTLNDDNDWVAPVTQPTETQRQYTEDSVTKQYVITWDEDNSRWLGYKDTHDDIPLTADKRWDSSDNSWKDL